MQNYSPSLPTQDDGDDPLKIWVKPWRGRAAKINQSQTIKSCKLLWARTGSRNAFFGCCPWSWTHKPVSIVHLHNCPPRSCFCPLQPCSLQLSWSLSCLDSFQLGQQWTTSPHFIQWTKRCIFTCPFCATCCVPLFKDWESWYAFPRLWTPGCSPFSLEMWWWER